MMCGGGGQPHSIESSAIKPTRDTESSAKSTSAEVIESTTASPNDTKSNIMQSCTKSTQSKRLDSITVPLSHQEVSPQDISRREISSLNPYFCELTAMYWAWKNIDADYYGLFHYRRVLDFSAQNILSKIWHFFIPQSAPFAKYALRSAQIIESIKAHKADIYIPTRKIIKQSAHYNLYEAYCLQHFQADLDIALQFIQEQNPAMSDSIMRVFFDKGIGVSYWNIAIWRKELFFEYCEWLFSVLFGIMGRIDYTHYDARQRRVFGYLSERLFNVWLDFKIKSGIKVVELPSHLLYEKNKKFFGVVRSLEYERYYFAFIRVYKRRVSPPPPPLLASKIILKLKEQYEYQNPCVLSQTPAHHRKSNPAAHTFRRKASKQ
ncbi:DUF4422 domain-containing protein [Helicobacter jaachi]|nr:DUF4422 domain-containing protein [Helicobacter jaachi]